MSDIKRLKCEGRQPCFYKDFLVGSSDKVWECPQCHKEYFSKEEAFCESCFENKTSTEQRLNYFKKQENITSVKLASIQEEIRILEVLLNE